MEFKDIDHVRHAVQKQSKQGIATPQKEIDLIYELLKRAEEHHKALSTIS